MTLTEFLLERIIDDEVEAGDHYSGHDDGANIVGAPCVECGEPYPCPVRLRALAECESKREIIKSCQQVLDLEAMGVRTYGREHLARKVLAALALPYANHPDYRQEWAA